MKHKKHNIIIGLDGATWKVITPLIKSDKLPFLSTFIKNSSYGTLKSTIPPLTAPAWVSMQTGVNPGKHGVFGFINYRKDLSDINLFNSTDIKVPTIMEYLESLNLKSIVLNLPLTYPIKKTRGITVSSFLTPPEAPYIYPLKYSKILKKIGYKIDILDEDSKEYGKLPKGDVSEKRKDGFMEELMDISKKRVEAYKSLSKTDDFQFHFILFKEVDVAQHLFWGDKRLTKYYTYLDDLLSELTSFIYSEIDKNACIMIMSDHGFHKSASLQFSIYPWLVENGYISKKSTELLSWNLVHGLYSILKSIGLGMDKFRFFNKVRNKFVDLNENKKMKIVTEEIGIRPSFEGLYLKNHIHASLTKNIVSDLRKARYKGKRIFKLVNTRENIYKGKNINNSPDVIWITDERFFVNISPLEKRIFSDRKCDIKGDHIADRNGIFIGSCKEFNHISKINLSIYDIFPIVCKVLGVPIPYYLDGVVPKGLIKIKRRERKHGEKIKINVEKEINVLLRN